MRRPTSTQTTVPAATLAGLLALGVLTACDDDPTGIVGPDNELIAFATDPEGVSPELGREIFVMRPDGSDVTQVTDGMLATQPAWSPDGSMVAFVRLAAGDRNVYGMDADGSDIRALTTGLQARHHPTWAPEVDRVLFVQGSALYTVGLVLASPAGQILATLPDDARHQRSQASFSRDGSRILYYGEPFSGDGEAGIYVMELDGSDTRRIKEFPAGLDHWVFPAWRP